MTRFFILENPKFKSFYVLNPEGEVLEFQKGTFQKTGLTPYELLNDSDIQEVPDESFFPGRVLNSYNNQFSDELERVGAQDQIQGYGGSTIYNEDMVNPPNELQELAPGANTQAFNSGIQQMDDQFEECYTNDSTYKDQSRQSQKKKTPFDDSYNVGPWDYKQYKGYEGHINGGLRIWIPKLNKIFKTDQEAESFIDNLKRESQAKKIASVLNTEGLVPKRISYKFKYEIDYLDKNGEQKTFDIEAAGQKEAISLFTRLKGKEADVVGARNKGPLKPSEEKTAEEQVKHNFNHVSLPKPSNGMPFKKAQKENIYSDKIVEKPHGKYGKVYQIYYKEGAPASWYKTKEEAEKFLSSKKSALLKKKVAQVQNTYKVKFIDKTGKPSTVIVHAESAAEVKKNLKSEKIVKQVLLITPVEGKEREGDDSLDQSAMLDRQMTYNGIGDATESPSRYPQEPTSFSSQLDDGSTQWADQRVAFVKVYAAQGDDPNLTPTVDAHTGLGDCNNSAIPNQAPASTGTNANQPEELQETPGWRKRTKAQVLTDDSQNPQQAIAPNPYPNAKSNSGGASGYATKAPVQSPNDPLGTQGSGEAAPPKPTTPPPPNMRYQLQGGAYILVPIS